MRNIEKKLYWEFLNQEKILLKKNKVVELNNGIKITRKSSLQQWYSNRGHVSRRYINKYNCIPCRGINMSIYFLRNPTGKSLRP